MIEIKQNDGKILVNFPLKFKDVVIEKINETASFNFLSFEKVRNRCIIRLEQSHNPSVTFEVLEESLRKIFSNGFRGDSPFF